MQQLSREVLADIQGIIFSGYRHLNFARYVFLRIEDAPQARLWLQRIVPRIATAAPWPVAGGSQTGSRVGRVKPNSALHLAFTCAGMQALGAPDEVLLSFTPEFISGIATRARVLGDTGPSAPTSWELGGPESPAVHLLLMVNAVDAAAVEGLVGTLNAEIEAPGSGLSAVSVQAGSRPESHINPFGFVDGISQPDIEGDDRTTGRSPGVVRTGEFVLGFLNEYGVYPPSPTVPSALDPARELPAFPGDALRGVKDFGRNGSYLVYRKLGTEVAAFWRFVGQHADDHGWACLPKRLEGDPDERNQRMMTLASKLFGRWPSGAALVLAPERDDPAVASVNSFGYAGTDANGVICPIGAHVRRVNPRDSLAMNTVAESLRSANRHRIVRRATFYGQRIVPDDFSYASVAPTGLAGDDEPRGLHFFGINADIARQFEFIQQSWCNQGAFNGLVDNKDPVVGDNDGSGIMVFQGSPTRSQIKEVPRFVTVKGGAYFFLPSLTALRFLSKAAWQ